MKQAGHGLGLFYSPGMKGPNFNLPRPDALAILDRFYSQYAEMVCRSSVELEGLMFSLAAFPDLIPPSEWMDLVWSQPCEELPFSESEFSEYLSAVLALYNDTMNVFASREIMLVARPLMEIPPEKLFDPDSRLVQWVQGYSQALSWLAEAWDEIFDAPDFSDELVADFQYCQYVILFFLGESQARETAASLQKDKDEKLSFENIRDMMFEGFPEALARMIEIQHVLFTSQPQPQPKSPARRSSSLRNKPCPCGSGKKYKKCCLGDDEFGLN